MSAKAHVNNLGLRQNLPTGSRRNLRPDSRITRPDYLRPSLHAPIHVQPLRLQDLDLRLANGEPSATDSAPPPDSSQPAVPGGEGSVPPPSGKNGPSKNPFNQPVKNLITLMNKSPSHLANFLLAGAAAAAVWAIPGTVAPFLSILPVAAIAYGAHLTLSGAAMYLLAWGAQKVNLGSNIEDAVKKINKSAHEDEHGLERLAVALYETKRRAEDAGEAKLKVAAQSVKNSALLDAVLNRMPKEEADTLYALYQRVKRAAEYLSDENINLHALEVSGEPGLQEQRARTIEAIDAHLKDDADVFIEAASSTFATLYRLRQAIQEKMEALETPPDSDNPEIQAIKARMEAGYPEILDGLARAHADLEALAERNADPSLIQRLSVMIYDLSGKKRLVVKGGKDRNDDERVYVIHPAAKEGGGTAPFGKKIGSGGMGEVYLATEVLLEGELIAKIDPARERALKFITTSDLSEANLIRARLEQNVSMNVESPHLVRTFAHGKAFGKHFVVMEYLPNCQTFRIFEKGAGNVPEKEWLQYTLRVVGLLKQGLLGIRDLHEGSRLREDGEDIIHRDIKPGNMFIADLPDPRSDTGELRETVKIGDFGIAQVTTGRLKPETYVGQKATKLGGMIGTPIFIPPEWMIIQAFEQIFVSDDDKAQVLRLNKTRDFYAYGFVGFESVFGTLPINFPDVAPLKHYEVDSENYRLHKDFIEEEAGKSKAERKSPEEMMDIIMEKQWQVAQENGFKVDESAVPPFPLARKLSGVFTTACHPNPTKRYQTTGDFLGALSEWETEANSTLETLKQFGSVPPGPGPDAATQLEGQPIESPLGPPRREEEKEEEGTFVPAPARRIGEPAPASIGDDQTELSADSRHKLDLAAPILGDTSSVTHYVIKAQEVVFPLTKATLQIRPYLRAINEHIGNIQKHPKTPEHLQSSCGAVRQKLRMLLMPQGSK
jgi:serine/threonine protein kinase